MSDFSLKLLDQYWWNGSRDREAEPEDATSHGKVALVVGGVDLACCDSPDTQYGINQSAVRLLQTAFADHEPRPFQVGEPYNPVFYHGCSILGTCPNCVIDFRIQHTADGQVTLDRFHVSGGAEPRDPDRYTGRSVTMSATEYACQVRVFAAAALAFLPPVKGLEHERSYYRALLAEHAFLLRLLDRCLRDGEKSSKYRERAAAFDVEKCHLPERWEGMVLEP